MSTETDIPDPFDTDLRQLFAGAHPDTGFEDRLVNAVRQHRPLRLAIPPVVIKAAIAAAAVLAVGVTGYVGSRAINGDLHFAMEANRAKAASNLHQIGLAIQLYNDNDQARDYGGGSDSSQSWTNSSIPFNLSANYADPFAPSGADTWHGWPDHATGGKPEWSRGTAKKPPATPYDGLYSVLPPHDNSYGGNTAVAPQVTGITPQIVGSSSALGGRSGVSLSLDGETTATPDAGPLSSIATNTIATNTSDEKPAVASPSAISPAAKDVNGLLGGFELSHESKKVESRFNPHDFASASPSDVPSDLSDQDKSTKPAQVIAGTAIGTGKSPAAPITESQSQTASTPATTQPAADDRKIIRTGTMEFDVDRFDTAQMQITKIVGELGGFVGATDSQKLPNGKVRGSITVRVPPERLDTLVLSLRALGDLKNEQITSQDISKEYTDLESELAADRAMQDRLLELIHDGNGSVKDLLGAENELGTWREKIEKAEGMIRYYNGQVAMSTLTITLSERDIQTPATAIDTETADIGIEAEDVEKARDTAMKALDEVKGRIVEAELKRFDAGQLAAKLVADVPPESAGALIDQLKMLGKVARLEINRQQTPSDGTTPVTAAAPLRTQRSPTRLVISIYNLANVAPRRTTNVTLAANDVEAAYTALAIAARSGGGVAEETSCCVKFEERNLEASNQ